MIPFNKTFIQTIQNPSFGDLPQAVVNEIFKDGRPFSHFIERQLAQDNGLTWITGCKPHDLACPTDSSLIYDQKTFTKGGCKFMPSKMIGTGRSFNKEAFDKKVKDMIYIIVSNVNFPEIKTRFVKGSELAARYPNGVIPANQHDAFFKDEPKVPGASD